MRRALPRVRRTLSRILTVAAFAAAGYAVTIFVAPVDATRAAATAHGGHDRAAHARATAMSDDEMRRGIAQWFAQRPERRGSEAAAMLGAFGDTVTAFSSDFDSGDPFSDLDTAFVFEGEAVLWRWNTGVHTVTNGEDSSDPNSGNQYNVPLDSGHRTFAFTFTTAGVYPFYCVIHEFIPMKGYVKVRPTVGVTPIGTTAKRIGFLAAPAPNPSRTGFGFRFGLRERGRVRGEVFDAAGRSVAAVIDRELDAGAYSSSWDGKRRDGVAAGAGVYWLRLQGPGFQESRRLIVGR